MRFGPAAILVASCLFLISTASGTTPSSWSTSDPKVYIPTCNSAGMKHWEINVDSDDMTQMVLVFDTFKSRSWSNLQFKLWDYQGEGIFSADCTLAS